MTIRKILTEPDPFLRKKSTNVDTVDNDVRSLMDDMLETMYDAPGIGLAAIQVGVPKRVIVMDLSKNDEKKILCILLIQKLLQNQKMMLLMKKDAFQYQISLPK